MSATPTVLTWVLLGLSPTVLDRVRGVLGVGAEASVDEVAAHRGLDLPLLVRVLTPDEWRDAMHRRSGAALSAPPKSGGPRPPA